MTITGMVLAHVLNEKYEGHKSKMARALDMDAADFRRVYRNLMDGGSGPTVLEGILELCAREELSIDYVLRMYRKNMRIHPATDQPCPYIGVMNSLDERLDLMRDKVWRMTDLIKMLRHAEKLMKQMRVVCCGENTTSSLDCGAYWRWRRTGCVDYDSTDCPCKRLYEFVEWLDNEMGGQ